MAFIMIHEMRILPCACSLSYPMATRIKDAWIDIEGYRGEEEDG